MLLVGAVPLLIGLILPFLQGIREIQEVSGASFKGLATETARKLDLVLGEEVARTGRIATDLRLVTALEARRDAIDELSESAATTGLVRAEQAWRAKDPALLDTVMRGKLADLLRRYYTGTADDPGHPVSAVTRSATRALFVTDVQGKLVASLNEAIEYAHAQTPWWQGAYKHGRGQPYLSDLYFDQQLNVYALALSLPVMDQVRYEVIGILHRVYDAKEFLDPSVFPVKFGRTGHAMVIDSTGTVLSCPILPTGTRLADPDLIPLVTRSQPGWIKADSDGHGGRQTSIIGFSALPETSRIAQGSTGRMWHTFVWQSSHELFAPIRHLFIWVAAFGSLAIGLLLTLGYVAATRIVTPIRKLQHAATLIGRGELAEPIAIKTGDEIEDLAEELSKMNAQLQVAFAGLTDQIELKTQEAEYVREATDQILDSVPNPVMLLDREEHVEYVNRASREAFDLPDTPSSNGARLFDLLHADMASRARLRADFRSYAETLSNDARDTQPVELISATRDPLAPPPVDEITGGRREIRISDRMYRYEWFHIHARGGNRPRIGFVLRDTTDESRLQDQLIQAEKSGSLGVLSAGIGHELNNPLCGIFGLGEAIQEESDLGRIKSQVREIVQYGRRMAAIIQDFTGLVQLEARAHPVLVNLNDLLKGALELALPSDETLRPVIHAQYDALPPLRAAPEDLRQAFMQVIKNALQALKGKGVLSLSTHVADRRIRIVIKDTGPGIPRPYLTKIFDPFFTTRHPGEGSGLGLTIVRRIVTKYGGNVQVESEEGSGTVCTITFPIPGQ